MIPQIGFHPLTRADGSATYADQLYSIIAGCNGPVEVQRRDELPEEAAIEVNVRPLAGVGGPRERRLEELLGSALKSVLLVHMYPRTLIQLTLQVQKEPNVGIAIGRDVVAILPSLMNAAFLALVDAGLPMKTTAAATLTALKNDNTLLQGPSAKDLSTIKSLHALVYDMSGALLLEESIGRFSIEQWEEVVNQAQHICIAAMTKDEDTSMAYTDDSDGAWLRQAMHEKVRDTNAWRESA